MDTANIQQPKQQQHTIMESKTPSLIQSLEILYTHTTTSIHHLYTRKKRNIEISVITLILLDHSRMIDSMPHSHFPSNKLQVKQPK